MTMLVDNPILNDPFHAPARYWLYQDDQPVIRTGRRPAGYYFRARNQGKQKQLNLFTDEQFVELELVNRIRKAVSDWRNNGYPGVTGVTRRLLEHWNDPNRERKLFFCQREAAETIIWLTEIYPGNRRGIEVPADIPVDPASIAKEYKSLRRYGSKMATGSGKTTVMAMLIAWSVLNKVTAPRDRRFSSAVLVVCPNLTVRERLQVLHPSHQREYYTRFDLVPVSLRDSLNQGRVLITNWHSLAAVDDSRKRSVIQRGEESDTAFSNRVLRDLGDKKNILVLNDEAHHAYRPAPYSNEQELEDLPAEEQARVRQEKEDATTWVNALDRIHAARGVNMVVDLSATPFYIQGSGYPPGSPFPWLVSDFGLVDAIESGLVKVPRVPVDDQTGKEPKYFRLWQSIMEALPASERATARRKPKPEAVLREAEGALQQLAGVWKQTFDDFQHAGFKVPPVMISVCDNTDIARLLHEYISGERQIDDPDNPKKKKTAFGNGRVFPDYLQNSPTYQPTIRIDSKLLAEAEATDGGNRAEAAEQLRQVLATVGKEGEPGEKIRCVVSVGMLTEGWDAQNVTAILGLRAFQSQLLCEQVVGRGLRRMNYDDFSEPEYVDVYGVPFEVIPVKKKPTNVSNPMKDSTLVQALKDREGSFKIEFPRVEGYVFEVRERIKANVAGMEELTVDPSKEPTITKASPRVGYQTGSPVPGPGQSVVHTRNPFHAERRLQSSEYEIAKRVTDALGAKESFSYRSRQVLFPQVLRITREYLHTKLQFLDAPPNDIALEKYLQLIVERLCTAIEPDEVHGEVPLLPRIERFRPKGSTSQVLFRTTRPCKPTTKSHVSHVVQDSTWEGSAAFYLEASDLVQAYVRNDHLDFVITYDYAGERHNYIPDFIVRLQSGLQLILEIKGEETEQDRAKYEAARRWVSAVNNHGGFGRWHFAVCKMPTELPSQLDSLK